MASLALVLFGPKRILVHRPGLLLQPQPPRSGMSLQCTGIEEAYFLLPCPSQADPMALCILVPYGPMVLWMLVSAGPSSSASPSPPPRPNFYAQASKKLTSDPNPFAQASKKLTSSLNFYAQVLGKLTSGSGNPGKTQVNPIYLKTEIFALKSEAAEVLSLN